MTGAVATQDDALARGIALARTSTVTPAQHAQLRAYNVALLAKWAPGRTT